MLKIIFFKKKKIILLEMEGSVWSKKTIMGCACNFIQAGFMGKMELAWGSSLNGP